MKKISLENLFSSSIIHGLQRTMITTCSQWSEKYRICGKPYPGNYSFLRHPWMKEILDCDNEYVISQKAAQVGFTEGALNRVFFGIDIKGESCLYVLPTADGAGDFSTSRFDAAIDLSPHLKSLFSDVKNIGHKRAGSANLFIRGSRSKEKLKSLPVSLLIFDEVDEMKQDNIPLALERVSGQTEFQIWFISTPTIPKLGVNKYFMKASKRSFVFECPHCNKMIDLRYPESLINIDDPNQCKLICYLCKGILEHENKIEFLKDGYWIKECDGDGIGYKINQLYSSTVSGLPANTSKKWLASQSNAAEEQEFYNSVLGEAHLVKDAAITDADLDKCIKEHKNLTVPRDLGFFTMGIDVGKYLHVTIDKWVNDHCQTIAILKVSDFSELEKLMVNYKILMAVIDANPERRKALEFAQAFPGHVKLCFYARGKRNVSITDDDDDYFRSDFTVSVDRTSWIDAAFARYRKATISLPADTPLEYREHVKSLVRVYKKDPDGNPIGIYVNTDDDHYAHSRVYSEIAYPLAASLTRNTDIRNIL